MGRKSDARQRILEAGAELFRQRAYSSIGVAEICAAAGVPKGSFYYFFASKQSLVLEVVNEHWNWQRSQWVRILAGSGTVVERLRALFFATAEMQREALKGNGAVTGCLFGNLALEISSQDDQARVRLQEIFHEQIDLVEAVLRAGMTGGEFTLADPRATAKSMVAQIEGLVLFAKLFNDPGQLDQLWQNSMNLLGRENFAAL
ncbi:TetR/AcrR family transcriptional repressor of nem operon [Pseudarthrobacter sp. W1I19]|uniref:TetR/AcrR family transcriptional regulator n=1 Tax=Pseudarthrobacter sp. W1I19 TaxID=3042288 RepID=UPI002785AF34|nr:TetR/AcrR family transcriptional regulator [Pseudarthrobacter sp. W1I19]MDQ0921514.1 TetR/AcrR family transcriptional repressor of nem operon [Pseudarthrobacter sp. W1I19]